MAELKGKKGNAWWTIIMILLAITFLFISISGVLKGTKENKETLKYIMDSYAPWNNEPGFTIKARYENGQLRVEWTEPLEYEIDNYVVYVKPKNAADVSGFKGKKCTAGKEPEEEKTCCTGPEERRQCKFVTKKYYQDTEKMSSFREGEYDVIVVALDKHGKKETFGKKLLTI